MADPPPPPQPVSLAGEVKTFASAADQVALGNLEIRRRFADRVMWLFAGSNIFVLAGLAWVFHQDSVQLAAKLVLPAQRVIDGKVVMALLGATTVQLGTVVLTITKAVFPAKPAP